MVDLRTNIDPFADSGAEFRFKKVPLPTPEGFSEATSPPFPTPEESSGTTGLPFPIPEEISDDKGAIADSGRKFRSNIDPFADISRNFRSVKTFRSRQRLQNEAAKQCFTGIYDFEVVFFCEKALLGHVVPFYGRNRRGHCEHPPA